tara:strand:+ start:334 stop:579 length:246 start_codon:yes stop_codon:yes gene_type:complete
MNVIHSITHKQAERITADHLKEIHFEMIEELQRNNEERSLTHTEHYSMIETVISIEVIMKELVFPDQYMEWKLAHGLDLAY